MTDTPRPLNAPPRFWAFVSNPRVYRIEDVVAESETDTWRVGAKPVRPGDKALIWKAKGREARRGVVALADVISGPEERPSPNPGYYADPGQGTTPARRIGIRYVVPGGLPLWHDEDPDSPLGRLSCSRATGGTVFHVTPEQWAAVVALAGGDDAADAQDGGQADWDEEDAGGEPGDADAAEGRVLLRLHKSRERKPALVARRKALALERDGALACEACGFDYRAFYGQAGAGYIECHHTRPVSEMRPGDRTRLSDLALVCANCHRMLHRGGHLLTVPTLREMIARARARPDA